MKIRNVFKSNQLKDFSSLFFSNILQKLFGLIREPVIAFFFGSSLLYAHFLMLQSITGIFSQFTSGNSMRANLLPRFTKIINKHRKVSLHSVDKFLKPVIFWIFLVMQLIQILVILYLDSDYSTYLLGISFFLSAIVCFNFYISIYLSMMQAKGEFLKYSFSTAFNEFVVLVFIYPFLHFLDVMGLVFSRIIGYLSVIYFYIQPMKIRNNAHELTLKKDDFNIPTLILGNFANIVIFSSRFISGSDGGSSITYFTYSVFILNTILTAVIANISTLLLRNLSVKKNSLFMLYSISISVVVGVLLVLGLQLYGLDIIELLFKRGKFTQSDVIGTTDFLNKLSYSFIFIFVSTTLFQPFFSLKIEESKRLRKNMSLIFIVTIFLSFVFSLTQDLDIQLESIIMIYTCSFVSFLLALYSYLFYLKQTK